jgi:hypothetical protein
MLPQVINSLSTSWDTKIQSFLWVNDLFVSTEEGTDVTLEKEYNILCFFDFEGIFFSGANGQPMISQRAF